LDGILASDALTYTQASGLILQAADILPPSSGGELAFTTALSSGWLPEGALPQDPLTLGAASFLVMKSFGLKGGVMYTLLPGRRYAYREMIYRKFIQGRVDPSMRVSGERLLHIISRVLVFTGQDDEVEGREAAESRRRFMETINSSLRDSAGDQKAVSSGSEGIQEYDGDFKDE
jgi:hypothetical protein